MIHKHAIEKPAIQKPVMCHYIHSCRDIRHAAKTSTHLWTQFADKTQTTDSSRTSSKRNYVQKYHMKRHDKHSKMWKTHSITTHFGYLKDAFSLNKHLSTFFLKARCATICDTRAKWWKNANDYGWKRDTDSQNKNAIRSNVGVTWWEILRIIALRW